MCASYGIHTVDRPEDAHVLLVNTCTVTAVAEAKSRRLITRLLRRAPHAAVCVTGCLAQQKPHALQHIPGVRWVVGNSEKTRIPGLIACMRPARSGARDARPAPLDTPLSGGPMVSGHGPDAAAGKPDGFGASGVVDAAAGIYWNDVSTVRADNVLFDHSVHETTAGSRTRVAVKIQHGCDNRCSYCIVPFVRGPSRVRPCEDIIAQCRELIAHGYKELVLTGTHIGQYADPSGSPSDIVGLVERIARIPGEYRLRLSSVNPSELTDRLVHTVCTHPRVCRHLHVSVQSLSPEVVHAMGREPDHLVSCVERLKWMSRAYPQVRIGGDVIVGFPTETVQAFEETCRVFAGTGFSYAHVFRYSPRPGTPAATMTPRIAGDELFRRARTMRELVAHRARAFLSRMQGEECRIIVEKQDPVSGVSDNYIRVRLDDGDVSLPRNTWCRVRITGTDDAHEGIARAQVSLRT
jgi:threonylcarbamoyladenosine tRNA methylthiotransferase MtaB